MNTSGNDEIIGDHYYRWGFIQGETEGLRYVFSQKLTNGLA